MLCFIHFCVFVIILDFLGQKAVFAFYCLDFNAFASYNIEAFLAALLRARNNIGGIIMAKAVNQEWFEKLCADVLPKFSEKKTGKLNTFTYTEIWTENPDGSTFWFYVDVKDNVCVEHKCGTGEASAPNASFTVIGPYENFAKVITGEWDSKTPLMKGKFKLKGNLLAAVAHLGVYESLIDSKKAVDWDYGV